MVEKNKVGCGCGCGKGTYMDSKGYLKSVLKPKREYKKPKKTEKQIFNKTHTMPDGTIHTGAKHTKNSKVVRKKKTY